MDSVARWRSSIQRCIELVRTPRASTAPKRVAAAVGSVVARRHATLSSAVGALTVHYLLHGSLLAGLAVGAAAAVTATIGDLSESLIKRDLGIKDMGVLIPGHGGLLDRFDSMLLVAPVAFHYVRFFVDISADQPTRILSGG